MIFRTSYPEIGSFQQDKDLVISHLYCLTKDSIGTVRLPYVDIYGTFILRIYTDYSVHANIVPTGTTLDLASILDTVGC